jgi:hypothetical protein
MSPESAPRASERSLFVTWVEPLRTASAGRYYWQPHGVEPVLTGSCDRLHVLLPFVHGPPPPELDLNVRSTVGTGASPLKRSGCPPRMEDAARIGQMPRVTIRWRMVAAGSDFERCQWRHGGSCDRRIHTDTETRGTSLTVVISECYGAGTSVSACASRGRVSMATRGSCHVGRDHACAT